MQNTQKTEGDRDAFRQNGEESLLDREEKL